MGRLINRGEIRWYQLLLNHLFNPIGGTLMMLEKQHVWTEFDALPPGAQYVVFEFIEFLKVRYHNKRVERIYQKTPLLEEPFVEMWKGRERICTIAARMCETCVSVNGG